MSSLVANDEVLASPEHQALQSLLKDQNSVLDTASNFCKPIETRFEEIQNPEDIESLLWRAWRALVATASQTHHDSNNRQHLIDVVLSVQQRPALKTQDAQPCKVWDAIVWQDLPILGPQMREAWNQAATIFSQKEDQTRWINLNAFLANLVAALHDQSQTDGPNFTLFGLWTIRTALESQEQPDEVSLQAAAVWFIYAAPVLRELSVQGKQFEGKVAKPGELFKDEGWRGFVEDRWKAWEGKLKEVGSEGAGLVGRAGRAMDDAA